MIRIGRGALVAVVLCVALACASGSTFAQKPSEDAAAIQAMRSAGIDLSEPQSAGVPVPDFPSSESAQAAWDWLAGRGFKGKLEPAGNGKDYLLFATKRVVVDEPTLLDMREQFEVLAQENGGTYERWGMP